VEGQEPRPSGAPNGATERRPQHESETVRADLRLLTRPPDRMIG